MRKNTKNVLRALAAAVAAVTHPVQAHRDVLLNTRTNQINERFFLLQITAFHFISSLKILVKKNLHFALTYTGSKKDICVMSKN